MGLYDRFILPPLLNKVMSAKPMTYQRRKVVPRASGRVLEIGFGAGHNLPFYDPARVSQLWALEPSREMRAKAAGRASKVSFPIEYLDLGGEQIPLDNASADTVLVTYTLCTIPDVMAALAEMHRVLKPDGTMIFCEHGKAPDGDVERWQKRIEPVWKNISGGCHLSRPIPEMLRVSGFKIADLETMYLPGTPRFAGFNYWGTASKA
ncbi:MAG: methyltransferase domain-containing protein [Alphaproteobacteria bacterium]|nr:methyltransferase domain-containing protein [Alphaproteobacteria bacterium]MBU6472831.1 methyltransferase domain-containing protein [Alphaproteobacteria bacterium]MDE2011916.1 class I SAM-dependent methyltransferase [Alphaproteobacteria bacterium]MDE2072483.1 class I SAM-dependent methyltransferase [Alphaproteobacteria bacterium]MDE2353012.1 class I SAM-dependent methyltransferase [Alphaproteobacteria bacterium]